MWYACQCANGSFWVGSAVGLIVGSLVVLSVLFAVLFVFN